MDTIFDFLFSQYSTYPPIEIVLEIIAVVFGIASVFYSRANNIFVFPTGIISTGIFVYLLLKWSLLGDMLVNIYYFIMSIYGWFVWTRKIDSTHTTPITKMTTADTRNAMALFIASIFIVLTIYIVFDKLVVEQQQWIPYTDIFTTAVFFVGMWLMAKRKIEHWYFWIVANIISIPLYFIKGFTFTSFQYVIFLILAVWGVVEWRTIVKKQQDWV